MMSFTHAAIALTTTSALLSTADPFILSAAVIASQLPDLDSTESWIGRLAYPLANYLEQHYPHRTITHSFLSTGIVAIAALPFCLIHWHYWAALVLGQFTGWFADCFTKSGVAAFYPNPARLVIPGNPRARIKSHSQAEYWILAMIIVLAIATVNLVGSGGITEVFARSFFPDVTTAADLFQKYGSERVVVVQVEGLHVHTSQHINNRFTVIEAMGRDLIAQEELSARLYKIGSSPDVQIRPTRVLTTLGDRLTIAAEEQTMTDVSVSGWLSQIPETAYVSGSLLLDDIEDVQLSPEILSYATLRIYGGQLELSNARPAEINALIREFWILTGNVIVKTRTL